MTFAKLAILFSVLNSIISAKDSQPEKATFPEKILEMTQPLSRKLFQRLNVTATSFDTTVTPLTITIERATGSTRLYLPKISITDGKGQVLSWNHMIPASLIPQTNPGDAYIYPTISVIGTTPTRTLCNVFTTGELLLYVSDPGSGRVGYTNALPAIIMPTVIEWIMPEIIVDT
jgi:hypothetical protein